MLGDCCLKKKKSEIAPRSERESERERPNRVLFVLRVHQLPFVFTQIIHQGAAFQGWLLRCCGDMLPVGGRRFHLCSSQDGESLRGARRREEGAGSGNRNAREALTVSGKWVSLVAPASSRCQGCEIPNYGCKFCTTASCLITPPIGVSVLPFYIAAISASFDLICFALYILFRLSRFCSFLSFY